MVSRRRIIQAGALAVGYGLVRPVAASAKTIATAQPAPTPPKKVGPPADVFSSSANFTPLLRSQFRVTRARRSAVVTLVEVKDAPAVATPSGRAPQPCFSLLFDSSGQPALPQGIYTVAHPSLGTFPMFLSPVGRDGHTVQAVINRRRS